MPKPILLVNYGFPPNDGIGGRRWAKFARFLAESGYDVHVIACEQYTKEVSPWFSEVQHANIHVHTLPLNYPRVFIEVNSIVDKIKAKILRAWYKRIQTKRIYDKTFLWEQQYSSFAKQLIEQKKIKNVIVTGAPFYLFYYTAKLVEQIPGLNFIADYRDPWIGAVNYGMELLTPAQKQKEIEYQNKVIANASVITAPYQVLLNDIIAETKPELAAKTTFVELEHFYDPEGIPLESYNTTKPITEERLVFVYGGALYKGIEPTLDAFEKFIAKLKEDHFDLYKKVLFKIYTPDIRFQKQFEKYKDVVQILPPIGKRIFSEMNASDLILLFPADHNKDYRTTKFFEYLTFRKPFVVIGAKGYLSSFIQNERLGEVYLADELANLIHLIRDPEKIKQKYNHSFDISRFSLSGIGKKLLTLIR